MFSSMLIESENLVSPDLDNKSPIVYCIDNSFPHNWTSNTRIIGSDSSHCTLQRSTSKLTTQVSKPTYGGAR